MSAKINQADEPIIVFLFIGGLFSAVGFLFVFLACADKGFPFYLSIISAELALFCVSCFFLLWSGVKKKTSWLVKALTFPAIFFIVIGIVAGTLAALWLFGQLFKEAAISLKRMR